MSDPKRMTDEGITRAVAAVLDDVSHQGAVDAVQALAVEVSRARTFEAETLAALVETVLYAERALELGTVAARELVTAKIAKLRADGRIP